ncbi:hypothetical protein BGZ72_009665 [Mortierella alpina]|nr:hypothetical protein BGZ72_009665 [Mortierella alpina]
MQKSEKVAIDVDFRSQALRGSTELFILPLIEDLSRIRINCRQSEVLAVYINSVPCTFTYQDSIKESLLLMKEGDATNHQDLKRRWSMATAEDDDGELSVVIPRGMIVASLMDEDSVSRASHIVDAGRDASTPEPSTPQTPAAAPVLSTGVNFATLTVRIDFKLEGPSAGVFFTGPDPINAPNRAHCVYTINQPLPGAARLWLPCLDRLAERCTWDLDFITPAFAPGEDLSDGLEGWSAEDYEEDEKVIKLSLQDYTIQDQGEEEDAGENEEGENDDEDKEKTTKSSTAAARGSIPEMFAFCPPGRVPELRHTSAFLVKAMEFFMHEIGSYPFQTFKLVFVEDSWAPTFTSASMAVCNTSLLHPEDVIDQVFETRKVLTQALAQQWFGCHIVPKSWPDIWVIVGLANFVSSLFLKKLFGTNEYRFRMKKDIERCCATDKDRPPLYNPNIAYPIDQDDLEFIGLKAPLVLHMLDKRMSKGGSSLGLSRVIPKILVSVMSGELNHNAIGTHWFLKTCRKVSGLETKGFSDQWIYNSGCPIFYFSYHFNRKKMVVEINMRQSSTNGQMVDRNRTSMNSEHPPPTIFTGTMTARIHEADGTPYEHVLDIQDAGKRFEVQFNTKYKRIRRNTKRFQAKQAAAAAAAREAEEEGDIEDGLGSLGFGAGLWENEKEKEEWQVVEWGQDDENGAISATFEWIRLDAEFEWVCQLRFEQPDFMWAAQLQKDRDVVAQYEAILALGSLPSPAASTSLLKTLLDTRCFFRVRMEAAYAIGRCALPQTDWVGLLHLTKTFQHKYCYSPTHSTTFQSPDGTIPCMPKPNDFSSLAEYYVQKAIPIALSNIRDEKGYCPLRVRQFLLDLLRFNDNTGNVFSDNFYISNLVSALGHSLIPDLSRNMDLENEFEDESLRQEDLAGSDILEQAVREIDRYRTLDYLIPSYHNSITVSCLQASMRLMLAGLIPRDLKTFMVHTRFGNFVNVRLAAFDSMLLLGSLENYKVSEYFCSVIEKDPSPYVRFRLSQSMAEVLGVFMAHDDLEGGRDMYESLVEEDNGIVTGFDSSMPINDRQALQGQGMIRKIYGEQPVLRQEVWRILTSNPYLEHRTLKYLLLFCDILYPPGEPLVPKLKFRLAPVDDVVMDEVAPPAPEPVPTPAQVPIYTPASLITGALQPMAAAPIPVSVQDLVPTNSSMGLSQPSIGSIHIPAMAPELLAAVDSSPVMQLSSNQVQPPLPIPTPIAIAAPTTPKPPKAKAETPKPSKAPKPKAPTIAVVADPAVQQPLMAMKPSESASITTSSSKDLPVPLVAQIKEEPLTSPPAIAPPWQAELKAPAKPPAKKPEPKPKPAHNAKVTPTTAAASFDAVSADVATPAAAPVIKAASEDKSRKVVQLMPEKHLRQCHKVWRKMVKHKSSIRFRMPVDPIAENIPNYFEIVKRPMDLSTIKSNLDNGKYAKMQEFEDDVRLMLSNCAKFNPVGTMVYNEGQELEAVFDSAWADVLETTGARIPEVNITIVETPKASASSTTSSTPIASSAGHGGQHSNQTIAHSSAASTPASTPATVVPKPLSSTSNRSSEMSKCKSIVKKLMKDPCAYEFLQPVDPILQGIPLYPKIITSPMDLGTIRNKLDANEYRNASEVKEHIELVVSNCRKFNPRSSPVVDQANALENLMLAEWEAAFGRHGGVAAGTDLAAGSMDGGSKSSNSKPKSKPAKTEEVPKPTPVVGDKVSSKPKHTKVVEKAVEPPKDAVEKHMDKILKKVVNHKHAGPFLHPVDWKALNLPNYPLLIKNPMDFSTIRKKLSAGKYTTMDSFADDVRLVCQNCVNFNGLDHPFSQGGLIIQTLLNKEVENAKKDLGRLFPTSSYATASTPGGVSGTGASSAGKAKSALSDELNAHRKVIDRLKLNVDFGVFAVPVDPIALGIPTYFDIIKRPMDFGTIEKKLIAGQYKSSSEVIEDVGLVFSNCATFNSHPGDPVAAMGERLKKVWENLIKKEGLNNPKPATTGSAGASTSASSAKSKTDSTASSSGTAPPKKNVAVSMPVGSPSKPKSATAASKMAPAYIPPSSGSASSTPVVSSFSPKSPLPSNGRRGSSTPAPTPLRKLVVGSTGKPVSASANATPGVGSSHSSTFASSSHKSSKSGRHDYLSGSDLSDLDDEDASGGVQPIRLRPPQLMSPQHATSSSSRRDPHDYDSDDDDRSGKRRKNERSYSEEYASSSTSKREHKHHRRPPQLMSPQHASSSSRQDSYDYDSEDDERSSKRRRHERSYSDEYDSSSTSNREHRHHKSSSSHREHKEHKEHREHKEHKEHREHREHKKHKKSRKHKKHKKRSSEDRDRESHYDDVRD